MTQGPVVILAASPRKGNTEVAARLFVEELAERGVEHRLVLLRRLDILPCLACGRCSGEDVMAEAKDLADPTCVLADKDDAQAVLADMARARAVCIAAPIFFYHLPAAFKALIDRAQSYYFRALAKDPAMAALPRRPAFPLLIAGRPRGEKLFDGSLLTLRYFLHPFRLDPAAPCTLTGVDGPKDLEKRQAPYHEAAAYARLAAERIAALP